MELDLLNNQINNLKETITLIDDTVKFHLSLQWSVLGFALAISGWALYLMVKDWFYKAIKKSEKQFEQNISTLEQKIETLEKSIKNQEKLFNGYSNNTLDQSGRWTPSVFLDTGEEVEIKIYHKYCTFYRIGDMVLINLDIDFEGCQLNSERIEIHGLPFAPDDYSFFNVRINIEKEYPYPYSIYGCIPYSYNHIEINTEEYESEHIGKLYCRGVYKKK